MHTPLTFPSFSNWVGRSVIREPSTTGTNTNVPKNPLLLISTLAAWIVLTSTLRKQSKVSAAEEQLKKESSTIKFSRKRDIQEDLTLSERPLHYTGSDIKKEKIQQIVLLCRKHSHPLQEFDRYTGTERARNLSLR